MNNIKKVIRNILGFIFILIGMIGGLIPIFQGWVFVLLGFILIDFKKKEEIEQKIINIISKTKCGKKFSIFWHKVKNRNKELIKNKEKKILNIYKNINKMEK